MKKEHDRIIEKLSVNMDEDEALKWLAETQTLRSLTLSVSTRGIEMGLAHTAFDAHQYHNNINVPSIYA